VKSSGAELYWMQVPHEPEVSMGLNLVKHNPKGSLHARKILVHFYFLNTFPEVPGRYPPDTLRVFKRGKEKGGELRLCVVCNVHHSGKIAKL
jgi:hypothetical protein